MISELFEKVQNKSEIYTSKDSGTNKDSDATIFQNTGTLNALIALEVSFLEIDEMNSHTTVLKKNKIHNFQNSKQRKQFIAFFKCKGMISHDNCSRYCSQGNFQVLEVKLTPNRQVLLLIYKFCLEYQNKDIK